MISINRLLASNSELFGWDNYFTQLILVSIKRVRNNSPIILIQQNEPLRQKKAPPCQFSQGQTAAMPGTVGLSERKELKEGVNDVVGKLLGKS